jgi:hypothetical protein
MIDIMRSAMLDNWITIREISDELGLSLGSVQSILTSALGTKSISVKFVPEPLRVEQKETRLAVARDLLQCANHDANFMRTIITGDESWVYGYEPETKAQSPQGKTPGSPRPKRHAKFGKVKVMLTVFFNHKGVIHHEYAPDGQTVNKEYYVKILCWLCDVMCGASDLRHGREATGSCTTTTPPPTHPTLSRTSWLNIRSHKCHRPPFPRHGPVWLFSIPKGENVVEGEELSRYGGDKTKYNNGAVGYSMESVPNVLRTMERLLGQVCHV